MGEEQTVIPTDDEMQQRLEHYAHTDGMSDGIGKQPSRAYLVDDLAIRGAYLQGYADGLEMSENESPTTDFNLSAYMMIMDAIQANEERNKS